MKKIKMNHFKLLKFKPLGLFVVLTLSLFISSTARSFNLNLPPELARALRVVESKNEEQRHLDSVTLSSVGSAALTELDSYNLLKPLTLAL